MTQEMLLTLYKIDFPILGPDVKDICYATQNRQSAVRDLVKNVDLVLVVGVETVQILTDLKILVQSPE